MGGGKHLYCNSRTRPFYFRRCKRVRTKTTTTNIESLPDELLSDILLRLPADFLHHVARLVCRWWSRIIRSHAFVNTQLQQSTYGLLLCRHWVFGNHHPTFVTVTQGRPETSKLSYNCRSKINASFNGLVTDTERIDMLQRPNTIYISNPATNQSIIPPLVPYTTCGSFTGIAFAAASNKYKLAVSHRCLKNHIDVYLKIVTFGVDNSWRDLAVEQLPHRSRCMLITAPLITEGFMHWTRCWVGEVVTLDVETETLTIAKTPCFLKHGKPFYFLSTGRFLSVLVEHRDLCWGVWGLASESGEWNKLLDVDDDINLEGHKRRLQELDSRGGSGKLSPIGWVNYPQVLALFFDERSNSQTCILYNLHTHEINSTELPYPTKLLEGFAHKNTLLRLT